MRESFLEALREVADRLEGEATAPKKGFAVANRFDRVPWIARPRIVGRAVDRPVELDFHPSGKYDVRVQSRSTLRFRMVRDSLLGRLFSSTRRVYTGNRSLDSRYRIEHQGGPDPERVFASPAFRDLLPRLEPFENLSGKTGCLSATFPCDLERLDPAGIVASAEAVAELESLLADRPGTPLQSEQ